MLQSKCTSSPNTQVPGYTAKSAEEIQRAYDAALGPPQKGAPAAPASIGLPPSVPTHAPAGQVPHEGQVC